MDLFAKVMRNVKIKELEDLFTKLYKEYGKWSFKRFSWINLENSWKGKILGSNIQKNDVGELIWNKGKILIVINIRGIAIIL